MKITRIVAFTLAALSTTGAVPCPSGVSNYTVLNTQHAEQLRLDLNCTDGEFRVKWEGSVLLDYTLRVSGGTSLTVSGVGNSPSVGGGNAVRLFMVEDGALHIENLSLVEGRAKDGAAIYAESSAVSLSNCSLRENHANESRSFGGSW